MTAEIIAIASLKDGAGKTTACTALAAAGAAIGLDVIAIDLDPEGGVSRALDGVPRATILDVLESNVSLPAALMRHPLGMRTVASHRGIAEDVLSEGWLRSILATVLEESDLVILDTSTDERMLLAPLRVADRIVIATSLDILSMRAAALTAGFAEQADVLDRVSGLLVSNVVRELTRDTERLLQGLSSTGLALDTVLWHDGAWPGMLLPGCGEMPRFLMAEAKALLREVATRQAPTQALQRFLGLAQGRPSPEPLLSGV